VAREEKGRHLYQIQKSVKITRLGGGHRREETVMTRLRLGHCALNKSLKLIGKHETGLCEWCQEVESVEHIIIRCRRYEAHRVIMRKKLRELGVQELTLTLKGVLNIGDRAQVRILLTCLRETGLYDRL